MMLFACSSAKQDSAGSNYYVADEESVQYTGNDARTDGQETSLVGDKVIYEGYLVFQTKDMDKSIAFLDEKISEYGAYMVSSDISGSVGYRT